ncbi:MAG: 2-C-methyl-D-erythritol 4-phosphate cytidylyltransferase [Cyclobacteriaceae bacterium]
MDLGKYAVIVAGGKGLRMNSELPKQFMELEGIPVLMRTVNAFFFAERSVQIILVLPEAHHDYWDKLVRKHNFTIPHQVVSGGSTRFQSVRNGLQAIQVNEGVVAIHDGVRPLVSADVINMTYDVASREGSAVTVVPSKDSIRRKTDGGSESVARSDYLLVQTPQTFRISLIKNAYDREEQVSFTDDASVFEGAGEMVSLVNGDYKNLKLTTPEDMIIAACLLGANSKSPDT